MRWLVLVGLLACAAAEAESRCRLTGEPWLEGRVASKPLGRNVDAKLGQSIAVYVAAPGEHDGKRVVFGDGGAGRVPFAECGGARVEWKRIEPRMEHDKTLAPNSSVKVYANAVVFGPRHGKWIGYDKLEYVETPLPSDGTAVLWVRDAKPSAAIGLPERKGELALLGVMHLAATIELAGATRHTPGMETTERDGQIGDRVFRYTIRSGDDFAGWLTSFFNVPYLFGSANFGAKSQAERYIGADCADLLVAGLRRAGHKLEYSSVAKLVATLQKVAGPVELQACKPGAKCEPTALKLGTDVKLGDLIAIDYVDADELPRNWDHIVALMADSGPGGIPDGVLGAEDLVADTGDRLGLRVQTLDHQGHIRLAVLRPRGAK